MIEKQRSWIPLVNPQSSLDKGVLVHKEEVPAGA
jgi:hypothetical protein